MKEYVLDVVVERTYTCTVEAESQTEAENKVREMWNNRELDLIDEQIALIDLVEEYTI